MNLQRAGRDYYVPNVDVEPAIPGGTWEASFDGGTTWVDGVLGGDEWSWLVFGPDFVPADIGMTESGTVVEHSVIPKLRVKQDPVAFVTDGPRIRVYA